MSLALLNRRVRMLVPSMGRHGGAETVVRGLSAGLVARGWDVSWVVPAGAVDGPEAFPHVAYRGVGLSAGVAIAIKNDAILHSHFAYSAWGTVLVPGSGPRVRTFYGPWAEEGDVEARVAPWKRRARELLEVASLHRADVVVVLSQYSAEQALERGIPKDKLTRIPGFIDTGRFPSATDDACVEARRVREPPTIVTNRRLTPRTGVDRLIRAMVLLPARHGSARLHVIGDGPQRPSLQRLVERLGLTPQVTFAGRVSDAELSFALASADLAVVPSLGLEGFGLSTLEALWHGIPVVATAVGANPEVLAPLAPGLVVPDAEPDSLARGITHCLDIRSTWDPRRAREYVIQTFSVDRAVTATIAAYEQALSA